MIAEVIMLFVCKFVSKYDRHYGNNLESIT